MSEEDSSKNGSAASGPSRAGQQSGQEPPSDPSSATNLEIGSANKHRQIVDSGQEPANAIDPDIHRLVWVLLRGWWIILIVVILSVFYAGYSLTKYGPTYTAHMIVRQVDVNGGGIQIPKRLSGLAKRFAGAIVNEPSTPFDHFRVLLGSTIFAETLDQKYGYVKGIFGGAWNEETQSWIAPTGWRTDLDAFFRQFAPIAEWTPPNAQDLAGYVFASIAISESLRKSDFFRIQFMHPDRKFALEFLRNVFQEAEDKLNAQEVARVSKMLTYVRNKLSNVTISEYRESLVFVIARQEKILLELQSGTPYIAEIIQPPVVGNRPSSPNVMVRLVLGAIVGVALGGLIVLAVVFIRAVFARRSSRLTG